MLRRIGGGIAGLMVAWLIVSMAEAGVHKLYPTPRGFDQNDLAQMRQFVATLPANAFLLVLAGWLVGTLFGTWLAARVGQSRTPAYVVGALLLAAGVANSVLIPQPIWFSALSFVVYIAATLAGARMGAAVRPRPLASPAMEIASSD